MSDFKIEVIETEKNAIPQRGCVKSGVLPKFPSSVLFCGRSGSGKTNLLLNILTRKKLLGNYYHTIIVFSPTAGKYDDTYKALNIPEENFVEDFSPQSFENLIQVRKDLIEEKGIEWVAKNSRVLIVLDDVIANRDFLQSANSPQTICPYCVIIFVLSLY
jgi:hypothetical protein